jgi:hypothetical protein
MTEDWPLLQCQRISEMSAAGLTCPALLFHSSSKNDQRASGMTQVVAYPPSKHEALSSNPSTTKKRRKKKKDMGLHLPGASGSHL